MSLLPPEFLLLLGAAFVTKVANRQPPLWERLISGLRFYDAPYRADVERVLDAAVAQDVRPFAPGRGATLAQLAGDAVDTRARPITYSHFPIRYVPWDSMVAREALTSLTVSAVYCGVAGLLVAGYVSAARLRGRLGRTPPRRRTHTPRHPGAAAHACGRRTPRTATRTSTS